MFKEHEKFWAFLFLGAGLLVLAIVAIAFPTENETSKQVITGACGALSLALGAATNALFRIKEQSELDAVQQVRVNQNPNDPVPTTSNDEKPKADPDVLPASERIQ